METGFLQINGIEALPQFLTSLAIGLLIGLERERNPSARAGLRTFALVAIFGTLSALLSTKLNHKTFHAVCVLKKCVIISRHHHHEKNR